MTIHRKRSEAPNFGAIAAPECGDGYLIGISLRGDRQRVKAKGYGTETRHHAPDSLWIRDLAERYDADLCSPFDFLFFHLPRSALHAVVRENGARSIARLACRPGTVDPVAAGLGRAVLPVLGAPEGATALFVDHVALALGTHLAQAYGGLDAPSPRRNGCLSRLQEKRATAFLLGHLASDVSIADVAAECGLSRSYFTKAFRQTTGKTPHQWLLDRRIELAKELLLDGRTTIAEIAGECGFADQSHLTRVFANAVGVPPGAWRRHQAG